MINVGRTKRQRTVTGSYRTNNSQVKRSVIAVAMRGEGHVWMILYFYLLHILSARDTKIDSAFPENAEPLYIVVFWYSVRIIISRQGVAAQAHMVEIVGDQGCRLGLAHTRFSPQKLLPCADKGFLLILVSAIPAVLGKWSGFFGYAQGQSWPDYRAYHWICCPYLWCLQESKVVFAWFSRLCCHLHFRYCQLTLFQMNYRLVSFFKILIFLQFYWHGEYWNYRQVFCYQLDELYKKPR